MATATPSPHRQLTVRLTADDVLRVVDLLDEHSFRVTGVAMPAGLWMMATLQRSSAIGVRIPVVAGDTDASNRQIFAADTEAGRHMLAILAVQATLPSTNVSDLPPAVVLPASVPVRPFVVPSLH